MPQPRRASETHIEDGAAEEDREHDQRNRCGIAETAKPEAEFVEIGNEDVGRIRGAALRGRPDDRKRIEDIDRVQDECDIDERTEQRQCDQTELIPWPRALDRGRVIESVRHGREAAEKNRHGEQNRDEDADEDLHWKGGRRLRQPLDVLIHQAEIAQR
jgi:hypothetical protein